jgi:hypothetical protein
VVAAYHVVLIKATSRLEQQVIEAEFRASKNFDAHASTLLEANRATAHVTRRRVSNASLVAHSSCLFLRASPAADPRDLPQIHKVPCRYCWGINNKYQHMKTELNALMKAHEYGASGHPIETIWPRDGYVANVLPSPLRV